MVEYIDKQEVLYILKSLNTAHLKLKGKPVLGFISATDLIQDIPPADVEPVVRCRDCKEYYFADNRVPDEQVWVCSFLGRVMRHDDFCSLGERKGGDAE